MRQTRRKKAEEILQDSIIELAKLLGYRLGAILGTYRRRLDLTIARARHSGWVKRRNRRDSEKDS